MGQKLIVPVAFAVLAIGACVAIFFMLQNDSPRTKPAPGENSVADVPRGNSLPLTMADFDVSRVEPDPVKSERPPQAYTAPTTTTRIVISGRVVDESGAGIADARVQFNGASKLQGVRGTGYADAGGNYRLLAWAAVIGVNGDPLGRVSAEAQDGRVAVGDNVSIADGAYAEMPDLVFTAVSILEGQVVTTDGEPASGAEVTVQSAGPVQVASFQGREPTASRRQYVTTVVADQTGRYSIKNLPPARYQVSAEGGYFGVSAGRPEVDLSTVAYAWQDVKLESADQIRGVLKDAGGSAIPGVVVRLSMVQREDPVVDPDTDPTPPANKPAGLTVARPLRDREAGFRDETAVQSRMLGDRRALTDTLGRFGFSRVMQGEYKLEAKLGDAEARVDEVRINQPDYALQIEVKTSLAGVVRDAETGLAVEFFDARVAMAAGEAIATPFDRVAEDGRFEYHPGGNYLIVNLWLEAGMVRISAKGYMPAAVPIGDLAEGDARRDLDVTLKPLCELSFELTRDGRRLDFEPVALLFDDRLAFEASSDQLGRVRIPRVAPAKYRVKVTLADGTLLDADLEVPATRKATLEAKLIPAK